MVTGFNAAHRCYRFSLRPYSVAWERRARYSLATGYAHQAPSLFFATPERHNRARWLLGCKASAGFTYLLGASIHMPSDNGRTYLGKTFTNVSENSCFLA